MIKMMILMKKIFIKREEVKKNERREIKKYINYIR